MKQITGILFFVLLVVAGCTSQSSGTIQGNVSIGPFCPVEQEGIPCPVPEGTFEKVQLTAFNEARTQIIARMVPDANGQFEATLPAGNYQMVYQSPYGIQTEGSLPFTVSENSITRLTVEIDTGIR